MYATNKRIVTPTGERLLGPLPARETSELRISRVQQVTDDSGRGTTWVEWTSAMPEVRFEPAALASVSNLELTHDGTFLTLSITSAFTGVGVLYVRGDPHSDSWSRTFE